AVARKRAKVRLVRVDVLDESGEAMMLQLLCDLSRVGLGCQTILVHQDDAARVVTKADSIRARLGKRIVRVFSHSQRIFVLKALRRAVAEHLFDHAGQPMTLLEPVAPLDAKSPLSLGRIKEDETCRPPVRNRKLVQK